MIVKQLVTAEELWEMPEKPGVRYELARGELIEVPGAGGVHALILKRVFRSLDAVAQESGLGEAFGDGLSYILRRHPDIVRVPDASFIAWTSLPDRRIPEGFVPIAPDLAVEIVSPHDRAQEIHDKVHEFLEAGSRLVWVFWPRRRAVTVYAPDSDPPELGPDDFLTGGEVLPGFRALVGDFFDVG